MIRLTNVRQRGNGLRPRSVGYPGIHQLTAPRNPFGYFPPSKSTTLTNQKCSSVRGNDLPLNEFGFGVQKKFDNRRIVTVTGGAA